MSGISRNKDLNNFLDFVFDFNTVNDIGVGPVAQSVHRLSYGLDGPGSNPG